MGTRYRCFKATAVAIAICDIQKKKIVKTEDDIRNAVETMRRGGIILYPTDTVWGIGCDATIAEAVAKV